MPMTISINLPDTLVQSLFDWYKPQDRYTSVGGKIQIPLGACHDLKSCFISKKAYTESISAFRALKDIGRMVNALSTVVNDGIKQMEKELLPVTRYRGLMSLSSDSVVEIMTILADSVSLDAKRYEDMMFMFLETPPFNLNLSAATNLIREWKLQRSESWTGLTPRLAESQGVTRLYLTTINTFTLRALMNVFRSLGALKILNISCRFDYKEMIKGGDLDESVKLPSLEHLSVSNLEQEYDEWQLDTLPSEWSPTEPLRRIIQNIDMPNLKYINARLVLRDGSLDKLFGFPSRTYPLVSTLELEEARFKLSSFPMLNLTRTFKSLPALTYLALARSERWEGLGSLLTRDAYIPVPLIPRKLRMLKLEFSEGAELAGLPWSNESYSIKRAACSFKVFVVTKRREIFEMIRDRFEGAQWVTDRSILDD